MAHTRTFWKYSALTDDEDRAISPNNPMMPVVKEIRKSAFVLDLHTHLYLLRRSMEYVYDTHSAEEALSPYAEYEESPWLLVCEPIGFVSGQERANWEGARDYGELKPFSHFFSEPISREVRRASGTVQSKFRNAARIAMFVTKTVNWVGTGKAWEKAPWHAWLAICRRGPGGYELWIYDCNLLAEHEEKTDVNVRDLKTPMQRQFVSWIEKRRNTRIHRAWIIGDHEGNSDGTCLRRTVTWLQRLLAGENWVNWPWSPETSSGLGFFPLKLTAENRSRSRSTASRHTMSKGYSAPTSRSESRSRVASPGEESSYQSRGRSRLRESIALEIESRENDVDNDGLDQDVDEEDADENNNPMGEIENDDELSAEGDITVHTADGHFDFVKDVEDAIRHQLIETSGLYLDKGESPKLPMRGRPVTGEDPHPERKGKGREEDPVLQTVDETDTLPSIPITIATNPTLATNAASTEKSKLKEKRRKFETKLVMDAEGYWSTVEVPIEVPRKKKKKTGLSGRVT